ncbi:unnamed protein product [Orchesella dallaii]|uniref:Protein halfway n=1 Tax=Orchesella dallaii TaxID=48710 RepID=A0ABP1R878_9HEXA
MSEASGTSLSPNTTRHRSNLPQCEKTSSSSIGCWTGSTSKSFHDDDDQLQCSCISFTKTQQVKVEEPSSCYCKPMSMSSAMKDKDKRHFFLFPLKTQEAEAEPASCKILSFSQQRRRTNGWNCANNCSTTRLKYLCPSISFFFTLFSLSCRSCHYSLRKNASLEEGERKRKGAHKYISSSIPLFLLLILSEIIQVSVGAPANPTQTHNADATAAFAQRKYNKDDEELGYFNFQSKNNHSFIRDNENEESRRMFDGSRSRRGEWDHDIYSGSSVTDISSNQLKFTISSEQESNNDNNKFEVENEKRGSHLQRNHEAVMMMSIPFMKSPQGVAVSQSQHDQQQQELALAQVTNDSFLGGENISNNNGDGYLDEGSKFPSNNNNKNNNDDDDDGSRNGSIRGTGRCWSVILYEGIEIEEAPEPQLHTFSSVEPLQKPISILCNGTSQLAVTLDQIPENLVSQVISIDVKDSSISRLNLTLFHRFPRLESLSVTHSNVSHVIGTCPNGLKALNISFNVVRKVDSSVFFVGQTNGDNYNEDHDKDNATTNFSSKSVSSLTSASSSTTIASREREESHNKANSLSSSSSPPTKISMPSRFNAPHYPENSEPITTNSKQIRGSRSFETKHHENSAGNESMQKRRGKISGERQEELVENTNESNDNDDLTPEDAIYSSSSKNGKGAKNQEETMTFPSIRTFKLASNHDDNVAFTQNYVTNTNTNIDSSSDSEKSGSYSYEEDGNDGGDYYQRGSSTTTSVTAKSGGGREKIEEPSSTLTLSGETNKMRSINGSALQDIDLSHNMISEIPSVILDLQGLKSLRLSGNQLKCDFVWEKLADWYMKSEDPNILKDGDETSCGVVDDVRVFHYTVLGVLKAKKDVVETCRTVDKTICHDCSLYSLNKHAGNGYNLSHQSTYGNVAIALKLDCSFQNLTELPKVPPQTWQLNVSGNLIKDLSALKEPMYENLLILDADCNEIFSLQSLVGTSFLDRYNFLSLQNNRFPLIPSNVLSSLKNMRGQGVTFLGANFLECDCDVVKEIKPLLLENSKQIKDLKEIYCKDMKTQSGESYVAVKDLQYTDLCYMDTEESNEMYLYILITVEIILILVIVAKVWHDQRTFRRTGILPWCSAKMPRLPCDAILESVKEPPHFNRSSSTNVRSFACEPPSQSLSSHVQLREVRSNSGQSEKSSQISQLSSFPSSSRTSSV